MKIFNSSNRPVDLDDGRVLAPGEEAQVSTSDRIESMVRQNLIAEVEEPKKSRQRNDDDGTNGEESTS